MLFGSKRKTYGILYLNVDGLTRAKADALADDEEAKFKAKMPGLALVVVTVRGDARTVFQQVYIND